MSNILTPLAIWKNFDSSLTLMHRSLGEKIEDGIRYERVSFAGRDTGEGRVTIFGVLASTAAAPSLDGVLILGDSRQPIREDLLKLFVEKGYTVLQVDYAGEREGAEEYTRYPSVVSYANDAQSSRYKQYVDESADKTTWYEWTAVGIYARKYLAARLGNDNIGLVGIRDGGEIAWKLAVAEKFACAVVVSACGWKAYEGYGKFSNAEKISSKSCSSFWRGTIQKSNCINSRGSTATHYDSRDSRLRRRLALLHPLLAFKLGT